MLKCSTCIYGNPSLFLLLPKTVAIIYKSEAKGPYYGYMKFGAHTYTHIHAHMHTRMHAHMHTQSQPCTPSVYVVDCGAPQSSHITVNYSSTLEGSILQFHCVEGFLGQVMHTQPSVILMDHGFQILQTTCVPLLPQVECIIHNDNMTYTLSHVFP